MVIIRMLILHHRSRDNCQAQARHKTGKGEYCTTLVRLRSMVNITGRLHFPEHEDDCMEACPLRAWLLNIEQVINIIGLQLLYQQSVILSLLWQLLRHSYWGTNVRMHACMFSKKSGDFCEGSPSTDDFHHHQLFSLISITLLHNNSYHLADFLNHF